MFFGLIVRTGLSSAPPKGTGRKSLRRIFVSGTGYLAEAFYATPAPRQGPGQSSPCGWACEARRVHGGGAGKSFPPVLLQAAGPSRRALIPLRNRKVHKGA